MHIIRCALSLVALFAFSGGSPALATMTEEQIFGLRFDGLQLGMSPKQIDTYIRSRTDLAETRVNELAWYDCGYLASKEDWPKWEARRKSGVIQPGFPRWMSFSDASGHNYGLRFSFEPTRALVSEVSYTERQSIADWPTYLAEAETRFGKADLTGPREYGAMRAVWCTPGAKCRIDDHTSDEPQLSLTYYPHTHTSSEPGDRLSYEINEGRARDKGRQALYKKLPATDPARSRQLYDRCAGPQDKFATEEQARRHYIAVASLGQKTSKPIWEANAVPESVFRALGIDPAKTFGAGVCFWASDVFLELKDMPGCSSITATQFRWARRVGDLWVVSLRRGGASTQDGYAAVQRADDGRHRKIWWANNLAGFAEWRAKGTVPMIDGKID